MERSGTRQEAGEQLVLFVRMDVRLQQHGL